MNNDFQDSNLRDSPKLIDSESANLIATEIINNSRSKNILDNNSPVTVPNFRQWGPNNYKLPVFEINKDLVLFRLESVRISTFKQNHEEKFGYLDYKDRKTQNLLRDWNYQIGQNSSENPAELKTLIQNSGQNNPAIITADGILIDGNRRKLTLDQLYDEATDLNEKKKYENIKVIILPGNKLLEKSELYANFYTQPIDNIPPSEIELDLIEYTISTSTDGKIQYPIFEKSISLKRQFDSYSDEKLDDIAKMKLVLSTDLSIEQPPKNNEIQKHLKMLNTLSLIDDYLDTHIQDPKNYPIISKMGYYQGFIEIEKILNQKIMNENWRGQKDVHEGEIGEIKSGLFNVLRGVTSNYRPTFRDINKYLDDPDIRKRNLKPLFKEITLKEPLEYPQDITDSIDIGLYKENLFKQKHSKTISDYLEKSKNLFKERGSLQKGINKIGTIIEEINQFIDDEKMYIESIQINDINKLEQINDELNEVFDILIKQIGKRKFNLQKELKSLKSI